MSTNPLITKINTDAKAKADAVLVEAKQTVGQIEQAMATAVADLESVAKDRLAKRMKQAELVALAKATQAGKLALQQAKRSYLDALFASVYTELSELSDTDYIALVTSIAANVLPADLQTVTVASYPSNRQALTESLLKTLHITAVTMQVDDSLDAGMILETADGVYDITLNRVFSERRTDLEIKIAASLNA